MRTNFHILVFRFSSIGDIAMCVPVIDSLLENNENVKVTFATPRAFHSFFPKNERLNLIDFDKKKKHKGILGLIKFYRQYSKLKFDAVADLHYVLRTHILRILFGFGRLPTAKMNKLRAEKKLLTRKKNKKLFQLSHTCSRYAKVFEDLGFKVPLDFERKNFLGYSDVDKKGIGIAPLAKHNEKQLPIEKMTKVVKRLSAENKIYLFGGKEDRKILEQLKFENVENLAGKQTFVEDLKLMAKLEYVISMDSANMHLASLVGTRVVSIWGATHPYLGFLGYGQSMDDVVQLDNLPCRPCSVFGNKPCWRGDFACMQGLEILS